MLKSFNKHLLFDCQKTFEEFIKEKQRAPISESVLSSIGESLKENIQLLGNRVDTQSRH